VPNISVGFCVVKATSPSEGLGSKSYIQTVEKTEEEIMKARLALLFAVPMILALAEGWAQEKYIATADEELYGTWTNRQTIEDVWHPQKSVIALDGRKDYISMSDYR
jgi:hypothetical protein